MPDGRSAYVDGLHLLARRELSVAECRTRLARREHTPEEIDLAIVRLLEVRALDDARVARAHARTALSIRGRGRLRVQRELRGKGIPADTAADALAEVFGETDERALVEHAIEKRLRGRTTPKDTSELARVFRHLVRQGHAPAVAMAAIRKLSSHRGDD